MSDRRDDPDFDVESTAEELPAEPEGSEVEVPPTDDRVGGRPADDGPAQRLTDVESPEVPADDGLSEDPADDLDLPDLAEEPLPPEQSGLASQVESLLFLSSEPVRLDDLAVACDTGPEEVAAALNELRRVFAPGRRGLLLREIGGGFLLSSAPETEPAARRLLAAPRTPPLTPAQAETLAIVAYLQPVSRPEITRVRGVAADSACNTLTERGMIEEAGRSQFGAVLYRTTGLFLKLFGLDGLADLPDPSAWDPTPEETATLRERLMIAGDARGGGDAVQGDDPTERPTLDLTGSAAPTGHAATEFAGEGATDERAVSAGNDAAAYGVESPGDPTTTAEREELLGSGSDGVRPEHDGPGDTRSRPRPRATDTS